MGSVNTRLCHRAAGDHRTRHAKLIALLVKGQYSITQLAELTSLHPDTVGKTIAVLRLQGAVRVSKWVNDQVGCQRVALFSIGTGPDAEKRAPKTSSERNRKARENNPANILGEQLKRKAKRIDMDVIRTIPNSVFDMKEPA